MDKIIEKLRSWMNEKKGNDAEIGEKTKAAFMDEILELRNKIENDARIKRVVISKELIIAWITQNNETQKFRTIKGIPADAVYMRNYYDQMRNTINMVFYHPEWDPVVEGQPIPIIDVVIQIIYDPIENDQLDPGDYAVMDPDHVEFHKRDDHEQ